MSFLDGLPELAGAHSEAPFLLGIDGHTGQTGKHRESTRWVYVCLQHEGGVFTGS